MDIVITDLSGVTKAAFSGRLDTANVNQFEASFIARIVPMAQPTVIDLTNVTFIASLGIRMLLSAARVISRGGAKFVMYGATPAVMDIIETTALSDIIPVHGSEADALAAING
jgi:anti-sigma B factor antagonist